MKTNWKKILALTAGIMLIAGATAFTINHKVDRKELAKKTIGYVASEVTPVMKPQRIKLDDLLSVAEKQEIGSLQNEMHDILLLRKNNRIGYLFAEEGQILTAGQKSALKESRDRFRKVLTRCWTIADRHEMEIHQLMKPAAEKKSQWKTGIKSLIREGLEKKFLVILDRDMVSEAEQLEIAEYLAPVVFLLWDPENPFITDDLLK